MVGGTRSMKRGGSGRDGSRPLEQAGVLVPISGPEVPILDGLLDLLACVLDRSGVSRAQVSFNVCQLSSEDIVSEGAADPA
jgi:UDP-3-O-acyl-N-acetylglucosamine deacetylase